MRADAKMRAKVITTRANAGGARARAWRGLGRRPGVVGRPAAQDCSFASKGFAGASKGFGGTSKGSAGAGLRRPEVGGALMPENNFDQT